ncbi:hypothetical protein [Streptomyces nigra]|uniref:hypothetical protein n=1 Tax=Streptomyces nigra TaxID=1827580 RepID=UPI00341A5E05
MPALERGQGADMQIPLTVPATATTATAGTVSTTATYVPRRTRCSYGDGTFTVGTS